MKNAARSLLPALLVPFALSLGCSFVGGVLGRNTAQLFRSPARVPHKVAHPEATAARLSVLWVGHATTLIGIDGRFVMTDPVMTNAVGELSPRLVEPGLDREAVPPLEAVLVSHMHFDHFSFGTLSMLEPNVRALFLPVGAREILPRYDFESRELPWWSSTERGGFRITAVPVDHVGGRWGLDQAWRDRGYTGWVIERDGLTVYFGGDTAFDPKSFRATRERFPHIDLALLPICPIAPRDFMRHTHMDPDEALAAFETLGAEVMVPIHFDTFVNSEDRPGDCGRALRAAIARRKVDPARVAVLEIGEQRVIIGK
jgi:N-acyl-phosphatidylethanolamine-hydrolysing phospholipase D